MRVRHALELGFAWRFRDRRLGAKLLQSRDLARHSLLRGKPALRPAIDATLMAGVARNLDLGEARQAVMKAIPQPHGDTLERRRGEPFYVVQEAVVERFAGVCQRRFEVVKVDDNARLIIWRPIDEDTHAERMSVHPR